MPDRPKSFGDPIAEDLRFVVKSVVGEENFIEMQPNRSNNYCCGGGGGFLQSGYTEQRLGYGKMKEDQILATGGRLLYCAAATTVMRRSMICLKSVSCLAISGSFVDVDMPVSRNIRAQ